MVKSTITQHWFRWWLGTELAPSHFLNQCWPNSLTHICGTKAIWVNSYESRPTNFVKQCHDLWEVNIMGLFLDMRSEGVSKTLMRSFIEYLLNVKNCLKSHLSIYRQDILGGISKDALEVQLNFLPKPWKIGFSYQTDDLRALNFKSPLAFWNSPLNQRRNVLL